MRYKYRYFVPVLRSIIKKTDLELDHNDYIIETSFTLSESEKRRWNDLFNVPADADGNASPVVPLAYGSSAVTPAVIKVLTALGVNFVHLRHIRTMVRFDPEFPPVQTHRTYTVRVKLDDIVKLGSRSIVAVIGVNFLDDDGVVRASHEIYFKVGKVGLGDVLRVKEHPFLHKTDLSSLDLSPKRAMESLAEYRDSLMESSGEAISCIVFTVPSRMGLEFAQVSGDFNFVHIYNTTARMLGFPRAFIQGAAISSYAVRYISEVIDKSLEFLDITFTGPVFVDETIALWYSANRFWLSDSQGEVVAHGTWV